MLILAGATLAAYKTAIVALANVACQVITNISPARTFGAAAFTCEEVALAPARVAEVRALPWKKKGCRVMPVRRCETEQLHDML